AGRFYGLMAGRLDPRAARHRPRAHDQARIRVERAPAKGRRASAWLEPDLLERSRPRVGVDQHQRGLGHAGPDAARPDELVERTEPRALVEELLDLMQQR